MCGGDTVVSSNKWLMLWTSPPSSFHNISASKVANISQIQHVLSKAEKYLIFILADYLHSYVFDFIILKTKQKGWWEETSPTFYTHRILTPHFPSFDIAHSRALLFNSLVKPALNSQRQHKTHQNTRCLKGEKSLCPGLLLHIIWIMDYACNNGSQKTPRQSWYIHFLL